MISKIKNLEELAGVVCEEKKRGKRVVQCHGVFDLLHPGHIRHFEAAKKKGDILVVTVTPDRHTNKGPGRPVFNERLRTESIAALHCVDYVAVNQWPTAIETVGVIKPDIYAKGSDYSDDSADLTGNIAKEKAAVEAVGGQIFFTDDITFSSTELLNSYFDVYPMEAQTFLKEFKQKYSADEVVSKLKSLKDIRVLVIGDTIIDEYYYCKAIGKPLKDSILATRYLNEETFAGGVLACANHVAEFSNNVDLVTVLGRNGVTREDFIRSHLKPNVKPCFYYHDGPTVTKRRFVDPDFLNKMFEVSYFSNSEIPSDVVDKIKSYIKSNSDKYDLILLADFGHGMVTKELIGVLVESRAFLAVNAQTNSANMGYNLITKYPRADYICIDEPELRLALSEKHAPIKSLIESVYKKVNSKCITVTRGHHGSINYVGDGMFNEVPVFSTSIVDRTGAGDAYLSVTSLCVAAGFPMDLVGFIGNAVGAMAVKIVCNRSPVDSVALFKFIGALLK